MKHRKPKTCEAEYQGRKVPVTVPQRHDAVAYSGDAAEVLRDVLRDTLSPQAVAAMANALRVQVNRGIEDKDIRQQLQWFGDRLVAIVGGEKQYHRLCDELGL